MKKLLPGKQAPDTRRRWTSHEKTRIVRQHLRDGVAVADLAEQTGRRLA